MEQTRREFEKRTTEQFKIEQTASSLAHSCPHLRFRFYNLSTLLRKNFRTQVFDRDCSTDGTNVHQSSLQRAALRDTQLDAPKIQVFDSEFVRF